MNDSGVGPQWLLSDYTSSRRPKRASCVGQKHYSTRTAEIHSASVRNADNKNLKGPQNMLILEREKTPGSDFYSVKTALRRDPSMVEVVRLTHLGLPNPRQGGDEMMTPLKMAPRYTTPCTPRPVTDRAGAEPLFCARGVFDQAEIDLNETLDAKR